MHERKEGCACLMLTHSDTKSSCGSRELVRPDLVPTLILILGLLMILFLITFPYPETQASLSFGTINAWHFLSFKNLFQQDQIIVGGGHISINNSRKYVMSS